MDLDRPSHINPVDWERMPWHARQRAVRTLVVEARRTLKPAPAPEPPIKRRIRVYRVDRGCWEITDGVSTARTVTAQAAWRLLARLGRSTA